MATSNSFNPANAELVARRITADPTYRIALAVTNNPDEVVDRYMQSYAIDVRPTPQAVIERLQQLWQDGYHQAVTEIIDVPWKFGTDRTLDAAVAILQDTYQRAVDQGELPEPEQKSLDPFGGIAMGLGQLGNALANWFGGGFDAQREVAASAAAAAAAQAQAAQAHAQAKAYSSRMLMIGLVALALAIIGAVVIWSRKSAR